MFKVICIEGAKQGTITNLGNRLTDDMEINEGEVYTVYSEYNNNIGQPCYILYEKGGNMGYAKRRFIPLSSIDERTIQKERELDAIINIFSFEHSI